MTGFLDSRLKIERANKHISDLQMCLDRFFDGEFDLIVADKNVKSGYDILKHINTKPIPTEITLITGDAIHNTRTALDLIISQIEFEKTGTVSKWTKFPFCETLNELVGTVNGSINKFSPVLADFIIDVIKPYRTGNDALYSLHDLDIIDKHRLIIPTKAMTRGFIVVEDDKGTGHNGFPFTTSITHRGIISNVVIGIKNPNNFQIKNYSKDTFDIFFDEGLPVQSKPIIPTLHQFVEMVAGIIESIEALGICETV
jgi:hypothetical protein